MVYEDFKDLPRSTKREGLSKHCVITHSKLLVIQRMMDINADSHQWFTNVLTRRLGILVLIQCRNYF